MKKISYIIPLVAMLTLTGCGSQSSSDNTTSSAGPKKVSFEFWHTLGQGLQEGLVDAIAEFETIIKKNEGVDVEVNAIYQGDYNDIATKIESGFGSSNIPSLTVAYPDNVAKYLDYSEDFVVNLDNYINDSNYGLGKQSYLGDLSSDSMSGKCDEDDFVDAFIEEGRHYKKEGTYSLPWMKSSEVMFYNLDAVKRCFKTGNSFNDSITTEAEIIEYMKIISWDELVSLSRFALKNKATILPNMVTPMFYDSDSNLFITKMFQNNIGYASVNSEGKGNIDFESGENRTKTEQMVCGLVSLMKEGILTTKILQNDKYGSDFLSEEQTLFAMGSSGGAGYNAPASSDQFTYKITRVPASNNNPIYVSQGPTLTLLKNADSAKTEYAWKFMKFLTNTEYNNDLCLGSSQGYIPVRESCYNTDYFAAFLAEDSIYSKTAEVLLNEISGEYITSDSFKGSDTLRKQVGGIAATAYGLVKNNASLTIEEAVSQVTSSAINEAKKKF